jgi:hypothetical protein
MTTLAVHNGVPPEWTVLARAGPIVTSPSWLRAMHGRLGGETRTFVVHKHGRPVLAVGATVQCRPRPGEFFDLHHVLISPAPALPYTSATRARRAALAATAPSPARWLPSLVVMLPGYECIPVGDDSYTDEMVRAVQQWADDQGLRTVAYLYVRPDAIALRAALDRHRYDMIPVSVTWDMPVDASGWPAYLARLPPRRRAEARRELARLAESGVSIGPLDHDRSAAAFHRLVDLRCQLVRKYRGTADVAVERLRLRTLIDDVCGGDPVVVTATTEADILGFALFAPWAHHWHCLAVGFDYTDPRSRYAYFATAYYGVIPLAAAAGVRRIGYGQGAAYAKRSRGCIATPLSGHLRTSDPALAEAFRASAAATTLDVAA